MATLHRANSNQSPEIIVGENSKLNLYLPFKPQYPHTNSPNWSFYISLRNKLRAFGRRSKPFLLGDHFINSHNHNIWILLGENWSWSQLGLKGLSSSAYNFWPRWREMKPMKEGGALLWINKDVSVFCFSFTLYQFIMKVH